MCMLIGIAMAMLQVLQALIGACYSGMDNRICTNATGASRGSTFLGMYVGWSNAQQVAAFAGGDNCTAGGLGSFPRSAYASYTCSATTSVEISELGE